MINRIYILGYLMLVLTIFQSCDDDGIFEIPGCLNIFAGRTASILVDSGDYMIVQWTIYSVIE